MRLTLHLAAVPNELQAGDNQTLIAVSQTAAFYSGYLPVTGRLTVTIERPRRHFPLYTVRGMQKVEKPAQYPVVTKDVSVWRNRTLVPRRANALAYGGVARETLIPSTVWTLQKSDPEVPSTHRPR